MTPSQELNIATPGLKFFADFKVQVGAVQEVGTTVRGFRRVIPIVGGEVQGDGWMARARPTNWAAERATLIDATAYRQHVLSVEPEARFD